MSATDSSENTGGYIDSLKGGAGDLWNLALDYTRSKYVDVERNDDDDNVPDKVDIQAGTAAAASRGAIGQGEAVLPGGLSPVAWVGIGLGGLLVAGVMTGHIKLGG